jgi:hypothetical protein
MQEQGLLARTSANSFACSRTVTLWPPRAHEIAAAKPPSPAPIMAMFKDDETAEGIFCFNDVG